MISIISPVYNEEKILSKNHPLFRKLSSYAEFIFVDAGSTDRGLEAAPGYAKVLTCKKGRAAQMNYGASFAKGDILFFLHADNHILPEALFSIEKTISENNFIGGCLTQRIDKNGVIYRLIESQGNLRARFSKVFYGDQGIFARKDIFLKMGGFPQVPIMEDVLFSRRLRDFGKAVVLPDKIFVSARRWQSRGIIKTFLLYNWIILLFRFGYPLDKIKRLYEDLR